MAARARDRFDIRVAPNVLERAQAQAWLDRDRLTEIVRITIADVASRCSDETLRAYREHQAAVEARRSG